MGLFSSETVIDVFVQRQPLVGRKVVDPVTAALLAETNAGFDFATVLTEETLPNSYLAKLRRVMARFRKNGLDYFPYPLPQLTSTIPGIPARDALPMFWLRNQNIDLNSCWWNIFTENGRGYNTSPTAFNDEYWIRDPDDPDINRIPGEDHILLSERFGFPSIEDMVPYELVYPEWFTIHPEYFQTDDVLKDLGFSVDDFIAPIRNNPDQKDIDHSIFGYFTTLLPKSEDERYYLYEHFRHLFLDNTFNESLPKKQSRCVKHAVETTGFYTKEGENVGWINPEGSTLEELQENNYYYEKRFFTSTEIDTVNTLSTLFTYLDSRRELQLDFIAEDIIVRKVKGTIDGLRHNDVRILAVRGSVAFPEFTNFKEVVYPVDPTKPVAPTLTTKLTDYDSTILDFHEKSYDGYTTLSGTVDPDASVVIQCQKKFSSHSSKHPWDNETSTSLSNLTNADYYEEIIIINPRSRFKGIYSANHQTPVAYRTLYRPSVDEDSEDSWEASDDSVMLRFNANQNRFTNKTLNRKGQGLLGDENAAGGLVFAVLEAPINSLLLKRKEVVIARSLSLVSMSIVKTRISGFSKFLELAFEALSIYLLFTGTAGFLENIAEEGFEEALKEVIKGYIKIRIAQELAGEVIEFVAEEIGVEAAAALAAAATVFTTYKVITTPTNLLPDDELFLLTSQLDDQFTQYAINEVTANYEKLESLQQQTYEKLDEIRKLTDDAIGYANPENSRRILKYSFVDETPDEFFRRTVEITNPGIDVFDLISTSISRWQFITHTEDPVILLDEDNTLELLSFLD